MCQIVVNHCESRSSNPSTIEGNPQLLPLSKGLEQVKNLHGVIDEACHRHHPIIIQQLLISILDK